MQQVIDHPGNISLSSEDTLDKTELAGMGSFFDANKKRIFANLDAQAAVFAFTTNDQFYNPKTNTVESSPKNRLSKHAYLCHNPFNDVNSTCTGVINVYSKCIRPSARPFLEFILDEKGLFRKAASKLHVIRDKDKDGYPVGIVVTKMDDMPIQVYSSLQITGRLLTGWGLDLVWYRLVNAGLSPEAALSLTTLYTWNAGGVVVSGTQNDGRFDDDPSHLLAANGPYPSDQPFHSHTSSFSPRRIMDHDPDDNGKTLKDGGRPNPCNVIWNDEDLPSQRNSKNFYIKDSKNSDIYTVIKTQSKFTKAQVSKIEKDLYDAREQVIV